MCKHDNNTRDGCLGLGLDSASLTPGAGDDDTEDCDPGDPGDLGDFGGDFGGF